jgi:hypothetical protein
MVVVGAGGAVVVVAGTVDVVVPGAAVVVVDGVVVEISDTGLVVVVSAPGGLTVLEPQAAASRHRPRITAPERFIASPFRKCHQCCRH